MFRPMKPETLARRARERRDATKQRRADLRQRLIAAAAADPDGIWQESLDGLEATWKGEV